MHKNEPWWQESVTLFAELSCLITVPVIFALFIGKWLDQKYASSPFWLLVLVGCAFVVSMTGLISKTMAYRKKLKKSEKKIDKTDL